LNRPSYFNHVGDDNIIYLNYRLCGLEVITVGRQVASQAKPSRGTLPIKILINLYSAFRRVFYIPRLKDALLWIRLL